MNAPDPFADGVPDPASSPERPTDVTAPDPTDPAGVRRARGILRPLALGLLALAFIAAAAAVPVLDRADAPADPTPAADANGAPLPADASPAAPRVTTAPEDEDAATRRFLADASALFERRSAAVLAGDAAAVRSTTASVAQGATAAAAARHRMVASNLAAVPFTSWDHDIVGALGPDDRTAGPLLRKGPPGARAVAVDVRHTLGTYQEVPSRSRHVMLLVPVDGGWRIAEDIDTGPFREPWDVAPLQVIEGRRVLVLSAAPQSTAREVLRRSEAAVDGVTKVWGADWPRRAVVVVPRSQAQLGTLLRRPASTYDELAAVATAESRRGVVDGASNRIWVNPRGFARITPLGRSIVLRHEMTHVATGAAVPSGRAIWLEEGFADYIGYLGSGVRPQVIASDLLADARRGRIPSRLPTKADFAPRNPSLSQAYEGAWWAARLIADEYGQERLLQVYRAMLAAPDEATAADTALRDVLGITTAEFTARWQRSIRDAAR